MTDRNESNDRAETARRTDDSDLIEKMVDAPDFGLSSGGNLQRDIGSRDEVDKQVGDGEGVTRVLGSDKPEQAD